MSQNTIMFLILGPALLIALHGIGMGIWAMVCVMRGEGSEHIAESPIQSQSDSLMYWPDSPEQAEVD